jgi:hypothetical protein
MLKSCSRIAGGVLVIATAGSAAAQINTLNELEAGRRARRRERDGVEMRSPSLRLHSIRLSSTGSAAPWRSSDSSSIRILSALAPVGRPASYP